MASKTRQELRDALFEAMRNCVASANSLFNNVTKTRHFMATIAQFYHPYPSEDEKITMENANATEIQILSSFINYQGGLPFFASGMALHELEKSDFDPRVFAFALASLRMELLPQFYEISTTNNYQPQLIYIGHFEEEVRNYFCTYNNKQEIPGSAEIQPEKYVSWIRMDIHTRFNMREQLRTEYALTD